MSDIIDFYKDKINANGKKGYKFSEIIDWDDYRLEVEHDFIQWIFPDKTGGVNINAPKLTDKDISIFKKDENIRKNVLKAVTRMMSFYGYIFIEGDVIQIKKLKRMEKGIIIGLYSSHNYRRLTRMMIFLNKIDMKILSQMIMLSLCYAMHKEKTLRDKIIGTDTLKYWFSTQEYLKPYIDNYNVKLLEPPMCNITGLNYTGNSCYQDSTLLALLAHPNKFITENILTKNLSDVIKNPEIKCGDERAIDLENRNKIQEELVNIAKSMRKELPENESIKYCSNLRKLLRNCLSTSKQEFHGTGEQDAGEFIQYLFNLFEVNTLKRTRINFITNDLDKDTKNLIESSSQINYTIPIVSISQFEIKANMKIENYLATELDAVFDESNLVKYNGKTYIRRIEQSKVDHADFLVFYAQRLTKIDRIIKRNIIPIIPSENIHVNNTNLVLYAIVVHINSHYTCYIKCDDNWFYYNDLNNNIVYVGNYNDMLNDTQRPNVKTHGILYFYK